MRSPGREDRNWRYPREKRKRDVRYESDAKKLRHSVEWGLSKARLVSDPFLDDLFADLDVRRRGSLRMDDLVPLGDRFGEDWRDSNRLRETFEAMDTNQRDRVSFDEFSSWVVRNARVASNGRDLLRVPAPTVDVPPELIQLLDDLNVARIEHRGGETLREHLISVFTILKEWGCDDVTCSAGLFHSVYDVGEEHPLHWQTARPRLKAAIGVDAEELVFNFQSANQTCLYEGGLLTAPPEAETFKAPKMKFGPDEYRPRRHRDGRWNPEWLVFPARLRGPLVNLYFVNAWDQIPWLYDHPDDAVYMVIYHWDAVPLMTPGAVKLMERMKSIARQSTMTWEEFLDSPKLVYYSYEADPGFIEKHFRRRFDEFHTENEKLRASRRD